MTPITDKMIDSVLSEKNNGVKKNTSQSLKDLLKYTPNVNAFLEFSNNEAVYYVEDKMKVDGKFKLNINRFIAGGDDKTYTNTITKENLREEVREHLLIELEEKKWLITQESKKIGNYLCFKAIDIASTNTKMKPIAWFTPQIPVSFGPKEFSGLPGLVILVELFNNTISAASIVLNPKEKIVLKKMIDGERISEEKYNERLKSLIDLRN